VNNVNWVQVFVDILQAIISGIFVGLTLFWLDERRALRERRLSDFRIASNWSSTKSKVSLRYFDLRKSNLSGRSFVKADVERVSFFKSSLWATDFSSANLRHADFRKAKIVGSKFINAKINNADFSNAMIRKGSDPITGKAVDFSGAEMHGCKFTGSRISGIVMRGADLFRTDFSHANVTDTDFSDADLTDTKWKKVKQVKNCTWKNVKVGKQDDFPKYLWDEIQIQNKSPSKQPAKKKQYAE